MLCCLVLVAGSAAASSVPTTMNVAFVSPADLELYPLRINDRDMGSILDLVYESLVDLDDNRQPVAGLAESWETINGKTWTFHLREGVMFHDGRELKASDVVATMNAIKAIAEENIPDNQKGRYSKLTTYISNWKAVDDYTLEITAAIPYYGVLYAMTFPVLQAQSAMLAMPPGTGPYRIEYYSPGEEIWLAGNQNWYGPTPYISEVVGHWFPTVEEAMTAYEAEIVDIVMTRSPSAVRYRGTATNRSNSYDYSTQQLECLLINNSSSSRLLGDVEMREVIAYAIDTKRLITSTYQNLVTQTDSIQSPVSWLYYDKGPNFITNPPTHAYNPDKANEILDLLGWTSYNDSGHRYKILESGETKVLDLRLYYYDESGNSLRKEAAAEIAKMLRAVGFRIRVAGYGFEAGSQKMQTNVSDYDLFLCAFNFDIVPDPNFLLLSDGKANYMKYKPAESAMNKLCQELRKAAPTPEDSETPYITALANQFQLAWQDIQLMVMRDVPLIPLYWRDGVILTRYPFSSVRDIREYELLKSLNTYQ